MVQTSENERSYKGPVIEWSIRYRRCDYMLEIQVDIQLLKIAEFVIEISNV